MRTLVIYDTAGSILASGSGDILEPKGVPFLWIEVSVGKHVLSIDVSGEQHTPVFEDLPKTSDQEIAELKQSLLELSMLVAGGAA